MNGKKTKSTLPFIKAYNVVLERKDLRPAEKLVLTIIGGYLPSPFWGSNATIAKNLGISARWVERLLKKLKSKGLIRAGYAHKVRGGKKHTVRVIIPLCIGEKCVLTDCKIDTDQPDGLRPVLQDGSMPTNRDKTTDRQADLLERNRKRTERARSLPLPALRQAKTLTENQRRERMRKQIALLRTTGQK